MFKEFKAFLMKGNILDIAIAFIMGAAFTGVVTSFTQNIVNPVIAIFVGKPSFNSVITINHAVIHMGAFLTAVINFVLIAAVAFGIVKTVNALADRARQRGEETIDITEDQQVAVLTEIRDLLQQQR